MEVLKVDCKPFDEISLYEIINYSKTGVYIIWDSRSKKRPTYIGEGDLMSRLCSHRNIKNEGFAKPIDGYVINIYQISKKTSTTNVTKYNDEITEKELKQNSELIEFIMLYLANQNYLAPIKNISSGKSKTLEKKFINNNRTLSICLNGYNPFISVNNSKKLKKEIIIKIQVKKGELFLVGNDYKKLFKIKY